MLKNAYLLATFGFDTAENEPAENLLKKLQNLQNLQSFAKFATYLGREAFAPAPERARRRSGRTSGTVQRASPPSGRPGPVSSVRRGSARVARAPAWFPRKKLLEWLLSTFGLTLSQDGFLFNCVTQIYLKSACPFFSIFFRCLAFGGIHFHGSICAKFR